MEKDQKIAERLVNKIEQLQNSNSSLETYKNVISQFESAIKNNCDCPIINNPSYGPIKVCTCQQE